MKNPNMMQHLPDAGSIEFTIRGYDGGLQAYTNRKNPFCTGKEVSL